MFFLQKEIYLFHILTDSWAPDNKQEPFELKQRVLGKKINMIIMHVH